MTTDSVQLPKTTVLQAQGRKSHQPVSLQEKLLTQVSMKVNLKFKVKIAVAPQSPHSTVFSVRGRLLSQRLHVRGEDPPVLPDLHLWEPPFHCHFVWIRDWVAFSVPCPAEKNVKMNYPEEISTLAEIHLATYLTKRVQNVLHKP